MFVLLVVVLIVLNFILQMPAIFPIIGDENTWLPIIANGVFILFAAFFGIIFQYQHSEKERARERERTRLMTLIEKKREKIKQLSDVLEHNLSVLNFVTKYFGLISQFDPTSTSDLLVGKIVAYKQEIEECMNAFLMHYHSVDCPNEKKNYMVALETTISGYRSILERAAKAFNQHGGVNTQFKKMDTISPHVHEKDKFLIAVTKAHGYDELQEQKELLLSVHEQAKETADKLYTIVKRVSQDLLEAEQKVGDKYEQELYRI